MSNQEEIVAIKTRFENSTESELFRYLQSFQNKWILSGNKNLPVLINKAIENFELEESYTYSELNINYLKCVYNIVYLQQEIRYIFFQCIKSCIGLNVIYLFFSIYI